MSTASLRVGLETHKSKTRGHLWADEEARWARLMVQSQAGDGDAYGVLLRELGGVIEAYIRSRLGPVEFLEDCVQETLLALHKARSSYDPKRPFRPWFFTIVRHKAIDFLRRQTSRRRREVPDDERESKTVGAAAARIPIDERIDSARLLQELEPAYRKALVLTKLEGLSLAEAATREGVSTTAMKSRVHRGLRALRAGLRSEGLPE